MKCINLDDDTPLSQCSVFKDDDVAATNKSSGKRNVSEIAAINLNEMAFSPESVTKMAKNIPKVEKDVKE